jgi:hypothetical protein
MTRKDYVAIAVALQTDAAHLYRAERRDYSQMNDWERGAYDQWNTTVRAVADVLARDNARFDRGRFLKACGVQS